MPDVSFDKNVFPNSYLDTGSMLGHTIINLDLTALLATASQMCLWNRLS